VPPLEVNDTDVSLLPANSVLYTVVPLVVTAVGGDGGGGDGGCGGGGGAQHAGFARVNTPPLELDMSETTERERLDPHARFTTKSLEAVPLPVHRDDGASNVP
jgi:hypothetical protein